MKFKVHYATLCPAMLCVYSENMSRLRPRDLDLAFKNGEGLEPPMLHLIYHNVMQASSEVNTFCHLQCTVPFTAHFTNTCMSHAHTMHVAHVHVHVYILFVLPLHLVCTMLLHVHVHTCILYMYIKPMNHNSLGCVNSHIHVHVPHRPRCKNGSHQMYVLKVKLN